MHKNKLPALCALLAVLPLLYGACLLGDDIETIRTRAGKYSGEMVWVAGGTFTLGKELNPSEGVDDEGLTSSVKLTGFYLGKYEVTQAQYKAVMGSNPSGFTSSPASGETQGRRPVEQVNWYDAIVFCNKLSMKEGLTPAYSIDGSTNPAVWGSVPTDNNSTWNEVTIVSGSKGYRLPTEAQWEYAAKGGAKPANTTYAGSNNPGTVAWYNSNSNSKTHEVGKKAPNELGLYDMSGNVFEWCWDWYGSYSSTAKNDPMGAATGKFRVARGGGWNTFALGWDADDHDLPNIRSVYRAYAEAYQSVFVLGFRLARP